MRIMIVEDEWLLSAKLQKLLKELEPTAEISTCDSICAAVEWLRNKKHPDLIMMDVELADGQCFEIFKYSTITAPVIFTTAYDEAVFTTFKDQEVNYVLKPIKKADLQTALTEFKNNWQGTGKAGV